ncbi:MAG: histidine--tRNA ligase [Thermoleophilia bacterium]
MSERIQTPRGTSDVLGDAALAREELERTAKGILERAGYARIETPIFEATELFARGVGESTDVVQKEMYTFDDGGGSSITLRPEGTAPVCRAYLEHGMHKLPQPVKLWYLGAYFRAERPQHGRYRQFWQVGLEAIGSDEPAVDAESILLLAEILEAIGVQARLRVSSLGTPGTRADYKSELQAYLRAREHELSGDVRDRIDLNPLRAFDADHPGTQAVMHDAPRLLDRLGPEDVAHFAEVRALLDEAGLEYEVDTTLVRGLDYYTRTVFEFESPRLGAQAALGGGGRYDRLIEQLGGPPTPGDGWAAGIERILLASELEPDDEERVYIALAKPDTVVTALALARRLRDEGIRVEIEQAGRSKRGQLKQADRIGARTTVILGDAIDVKDMASGEQREAADADEAVALVREALT